MRELRFDLVTFSDARKKSMADNPKAMGSQWRKFKQKHFIGNAFNAAFPLSGIKVWDRG